MKRLRYLILIFISSACSKEIPFDQELWMKRSDIFYDHREFMIKDLAENHFNSSMTYAEIIDLLGPSTHHQIPTTKKELRVDFEVIEKYGWDIDPIETRYLSIVLDSDSTLNKVYLEIWRANSGTETIEMKIKK